MVGREVLAQAGTLSSNSAPMHLLFSSPSTAEQSTRQNFSFPTIRTSSPLRPSYLHDPIPVVARGHLEEREEGHPEVLKGSVAAHALTGVLIIAY